MILYLQNLFVNMTHIVAIKESATQPQENVNATKIGYQMIVHLHVSVFIQKYMFISLISITDC